MDKDLKADLIQLIDTQMFQTTKEFRVLEDKAGGTLDKRIVLEYVDKLDKLRGMLNDVEAL